MALDTQAYYRANFYRSLL